MAEFYPFPALRPAKGNAEKTACLPYDVLSEAQAASLAENPASFIHVIRSETDLPEGTDPYSDEVYEKAHENLESLKEQGILVRDPRPCYYIYREIASDHVQTGIVGTVSVQEYEAGVIRRHELTVAEKEDDRTRHILACRAQTGLVFLTFPEQEAIRRITDAVTAEAPEEDFLLDGVRHQVWSVSDNEHVQALSDAFAAEEILYIADGHHRAASSRRAANELQAGADSEAGRIMAAAFPAEDLSLLGYHRFVNDLNGYRVEEFLDQIRASFTVTETEQKLPSKAHEILLVTGGKTYLLVPSSGTYCEDDPIERLDVSILQNNLLAPVLGISDPRRDKRISFIGGVHGPEEVRACAAKEGTAGFILYPTDIHDLMAVAKAHGIMPPKSTWFEPKLLSGLFVHEF